MICFLNSKMVIKNMLIYFENKITNFNKFNQDSFIIILLLIFAGILLSLGVMTQPDTSSYLYADNTRSALYPLLLKTYTAIFKEKFIWLILAQILMGILASYNLSKSFANYFNLPYLKFKGCRIVALTLLLSPYWGMLKIGNNILTEAICYPLFLFAVDHLFCAIINNNYNA